jgi:hypothetical protein
VDRVNVANQDIKGAEALSAPIAVDGEPDFTIVQSNAPNSRILDGRAAENLRPACRHLRRILGLHVPLPTLRLHPRGCRRTARGRCRSLFLTSRWTFTTNSSPVLSRRTLFFDESPLGIYTLLRQTAMNQNKRVFEIAEAIISMADLFRTQQDT